MTTHDSAAQRALATAPARAGSEPGLREEAIAEGFDSLTDYVANLKVSATTYRVERNSARDAYRRHRDESEARGKLINIVLGLVDAPADANVVQAVAAALAATPEQPAQTQPAVWLTGAQIEAIYRDIWGVAMIDVHHKQFARAIEAALAAAIKAEPESIERNFCTRCGKRLVAGDVHTCTPPLMGSEHA